MFISLVPGFRADVAGRRGVSYMNLKLIWIVAWISNFIHNFCMYVGIVYLCQDSGHWLYVWCG